MQYLYSFEKEADDVESVDYMFIEVNGLGFRHGASQPIFWVQGQADGREKD